MVTNPQPFSEKLYFFKARGINNTNGPQALYL